ncbi:MAG TPA: SurA N-terminal domain-containing protein [Gammaproteobacteria bacterium]|nr:SurA N-terminal domain-containing protein [Gammaproteobacteria bacterium]
MKPFRMTCLALCLLLSSTSLLAKDHRETLDGIAAVVNDSAVTESEVNLAESTARSQLEGSNTPVPPRDELRRKVLQQVIDRKLQLQAAEQAGIKISETQVDQTIDTIAKQNGVTADVLYEKVASQHLSRSEYRKEIRDELALQQIQQQQVASKVMMKPDEVKNFMRSKAWQKAATSGEPTNIPEYHVEDLVVLLPETASADDVAKAKTAATALLTKAKQGTSFTSLALPDDKTLENNDLGWHTLNDLPSAFTNAIATAKKGSVMDPIQTGNGFHILRLVETRQQKNAAPSAGGPAPTEQEAQEMVYQRKFAEVLKKWVAKLHSQAVINLHPDSIA